MEKILKMIENNPSIISTIENPTEEAKKLAVSTNYEALRYIKNPSYDIELIAIKNNEASISLINLDKILFVYKYGSRKAKKITVDEKLKF